MAGLVSMTLNWWGKRSGWDGIGWWLLRTNTTRTLMHPWEVVEHGGFSLFVTSLNDDLLFHFMHSGTVSSYNGMDKRETIVAWWTLWCDELPIWCSFMNCQLLSHACQRRGELRKPSAAAFQRESSRCQVTEHKRVSAFKAGDPLSLPLLASSSCCWDPMLDIACVPLHAPSSSQPNIVWFWSASPRRSPLWRCRLLCFSERIFPRIELK